MIRLTEIKGLKYPDEFIVRYFFKEGLFQKHGRVLELGCGNGSNLMLFHQYGWDVVGIDIDEVSLDQAEYNFKGIDQPDASYEFLRHDLSVGLPKIDGTFDAVVMPSVMYYIPRAAMISCMNDVRGIMSPDASFYMRMRKIGDYRYGRGRRVEPNGFALEISETGEQGVQIVFYHHYELIDMLREHLHVDMNSLRIFNSSFDNLQNNVLVTGNNDVIIWGRV